MLSVFAKEVNSFLNSLIAYIVIAVFLVGIGMFTWVIPETSILEWGFADLDTLFSMAPYVFLFLIPAVTMRSFAEERKAGTMELLLTKPLTDWQIILGKYFACLVLVVLALLPTLVYYYTVWELGNPQGNVDSAAVIGSYLGLLLLGAVFTAIGLFASSLSDNQIVSFVLAVFLCFVIYEGFAALASINVWGQAARLIDQLGIAYHYATISKGLIDSRDVLYFVSVIAVMLSSTHLVLGSRKW
ncbi:ABC-2 type transport system permease protein [Catalinimonas alkaloidigena]|uniref:ABC-2 type transport system permease protein n=1 Tax=Catalinimonas alkaloidigena TaxID=1075417 RepID=A0A1G9GBD6_9BACT|nr:gliding motility-associated ABC transporter permease subunit GldF [Catalinimonas alkaloidigena]SDK97937.1 ABC-2 type transport system permease protein [Catalinimonas alkaloidigena]